MRLFLKSDLLKSNNEVKKSLDLSNFIVKGRGRAIGPKDGRGNGPMDGRGGKCEGRIPEGEEFGKPMNRRKGESSNEFMSRIVRHLMEDKGYDQKRAVAAAYSMSGHPKAGKPVAKSLYLAL